MITPTFLKEQALLAQGYTAIGGIDEVGRGCWAGPVTTACVIFPPEFIINPPEWAAKVRDSKTLSRKQLRYLEPLIRAAAICSTGEAAASAIDLHGINKATKSAITWSIEHLAQQPDYLLFDGHESINMPIKQEAIINGDATVFTIAAASIVAKVERDNVMATYDEIYPGYGFEQNVGYGTPSHRAALQQFGTCDIHRKSYKPVKALQWPTE